MRCLSRLMAIALCCMVEAEPNNLPVGDDRSGYDHTDYQSASTQLGPVSGVRLALNELVLAPPLGLPALEGAPDKAEIDLGRRLFFDRRLSVNGTLSCAMCHIPEQGFTQNELATPIGIEGQLVRRNAPTLYNVAYVQYLFHDGRETNLSEQIWEPLLAVNEMGNPNPEAVLARLAQLEDYDARFDALYPEGLTQNNFGRALAAYQRALLSANSRFDRWYFGREPTLLSEQEARGFVLFKTQGCSACHVIGTEDALLTNGQFYNTGIGYRAENKHREPIHVQLAPGVFVKPTIKIHVPLIDDQGRFEVSGADVDRHRYRTPSLRNVASTGPYMHDGSIATLAEVIDYYDGGGGADPAQDPRLKSLGLRAQDKTALVSYLHTLTGSNLNALAADARSVAIGDNKCCLVRPSESLDRAFE